MFLCSNGILLPKLFWLTVRKKILVIEKNFWNKRMKAKNLQIFEVTRTIYSNSERSVPNFWNRMLFQLLLGYFSDLIQSHWCHTMVDCAKFWINYQQLAFLSSYSRWQLIQNLVPSTIMRCQCDIRIHQKKFNLEKLIEI